MKLLTIIRMVSFVMMTATSVPLIIHYFQGSTVPFPWVTSLHVYFGILFVLVAVPGMIMMRRNKSET